VPVWRVCTVIRLTNPRTQQKKHQGAFPILAESQPKRGPASCRRTPQMATCPVRRLRRHTTPFSLKAGRQRGVYLVTEFVVPSHRREVLIGRLGSRCCRSHHICLFYVRYGAAWTSRSLFRGPIPRRAVTLRSAPAQRRRPLTNVGFYPVPRRACCLIPCGPPPRETVQANARERAPTGCQGS